MKLKDSIENLHRELDDKQFTGDIYNLIRTDAPAYNVYKAGDIVEQELLSKI